MLFQSLVQTYPGLSELALVQEDARRGGDLGARYLQLFRDRLVAMHGPAVLNRLPTLQEQEAKYLSDLGRAFRAVGIE
jgi:hypothetical protein